jgi:GNAT superfamily N-acetyltransferase
MALLFRSPRPDEIASAQELVVDSINDLTERHGFGRIASRRPADFQFFSLKDDPDGLWLAEDGGTILGYAHSWVCGSLWFLSELFIPPDQQGRGIGGELMRRTLRQAETAGAADRALITFAFNRVSQGLYIRHGLYPRLPLFVCSVARAEMLPHLAGEPLISIRLEDNAAHFEALAAADRAALGCSREKHHRFLMRDDKTMQGWLLHAGNDCVGYVYVSEGGHIGPLAVTSRDAMEPAFRTALGLAAARGSERISAVIPGNNEAAFRLAAAFGMRIALPMLLMSSRDFGDWRLYLPRNPGFM